MSVSTRPLGPLDPTRPLSDTDSRRSASFEAVIALVSRTGLADPSTAPIAARPGAARASVHQHLSNDQEILLAHRQEAADYL